MNNDINLIKKLYSGIGYKFANVDSKIRKIDENNFDIAIEISKGNLTRIKKIFLLVIKKLKREDLEM